MTGVPNSEVVGAIYQLLPGFVAAWIFYGLTTHPKASPFERVIQALIFTLFADVAVQGIEYLLVSPDWPNPIGKWTEKVAFTWKVLIAIVLGVTFAIGANSSRLHNWLPNWITKRTSYPSEWFSAFYRIERHVYLHLHDGRRLFGWAEEFPDSPDKGHFILLSPEWILPDNERVSLVLTDRFLIAASDVRFVEFEKDLEVVFSSGDEAKSETQRMLEYNSVHNTNDGEDANAQTDERQ